MVDELLTVKIKKFWRDGGYLSGYRSLHLEPIDDDVACGRDRVLRLMRQAGISAQQGYKKTKGMYGVSDITYIYMHEGFYI